MKKLLWILAITCASPVLAAEDPKATPTRAADYRIGTEFAKYTEVLNVPPGFVKHWIAPQPFTIAVPGTPEVIEILQPQSGNRELVFMIKPEGGETDIILLNDNGEQVAKLLVVNPPKFVAPSLRLVGDEVGPAGWQVFHKDNYDYLPPKEKEQK